MKILVDKMPTEPTKCPYCEDRSTMNYDEYICTYRRWFRCYSTYDCPWFTEMPSARDIVDEGLSERDNERMMEMGW